MKHVQFDAQEVKTALRRLLRQITNTQPLLRGIGQIVVKGTKERFKSGIDPAGQPWAPNAPSTIERWLNRYQGVYKKGTRTLTAKGRKFAANKRPLIGETKNLSRNIYRVVEKNSVLIGSTMKYGPTHQFGARRGQYGTDRHGRPIPWGHIPARPFLGLSADDRAKIEEFARRYLARAFGRRITLPTDPNDRG